MPKKHSAKHSTEPIPQTAPQAEVSLAQAVPQLHPSLLSQGVKDVFVWAAPERIYKPKDLNWILNSILVLLVIVAILLFLREFILIAVVLAVTFLIYVLSTVPPRSLEIKITTQGVVVGEHSYIWDELTEFWLDQKDGHSLLVIQTALQFPQQLTLLLDGQSPEEIRHYLVNYLPFREKPTQNWVEHLSKRVEQKLSL